MNGDVIIGGSPFGAAAGLNILVSGAKHGFMVGNNASQQWAFVGKNSENNNQVNFGGGSLTQGAFEVRAGGTLGSFVVTNNGNVGIGTTGPITPLHVYASSANARLLLDNPSNSSPGFQFGTAGSSNWAIYRPANSTDFRWYDYGGTPGDRVTFKTGGNVGIGTTSPSQKLHVEGQCVTGDTLLPILATTNPKSEIRNSKQITNSNSPNPKQESLGFSASNLEFLPIKAVKGGEYVLSLDEETGKIVPARIKGLLDMGVKPVYRLTTEDGRSIETTGNHPYLTKNGWKKVIYLKEGQEIAAAQNLPLPTGLRGTTPSDISDNRNHQAQNSKGEIEKDQIIRIHDFDLTNKILPNQKTAETTDPNATIPTLNLSSRKGITTEAKETCPISAQISESLLNRALTKSIGNYSNINKSADVKWVKITSIEYVGEKQVFDIEVEGTHNFVANGIIAHNTYLSGNVGIGTTGPSAKLHVEGDYRIILKNLATAGHTRLELDASSITNGRNFYVASYADGTNAGSFRIYDASGGGDRFVIDNSGLVGIGTVFATGAPADRLTVAGGSGTIYNTASLGSEKVTNGTFADATAWTWGTGWAHDAVNLEADHTAGNVLALEQSVSAVAGEIYQVVFTVLNRTAGSVTPQVGGVNGAAVSSNSTSTQQIRATGTGNLKFTPTTDFDGSVDTVSVKLITGGDLKLAGLLTGGGSSGIKVTAAGNVGIGTTGPNRLLHIYANDASTGQLRIEQDSTGDAAINFELTDAQGWSMGIDNTDDSFHLSTSANAVSTNTKLTIKTTGNVGIGTTGPEWQLTVGSSGGNIGSGTKGSPQNIDLWSGITTGNPALKIYGWDNGASSTKNASLTVNNEGILRILAPSDGFDLYTAGTMRIQDLGDGAVDIFPRSGSGENRYLSIYGYDTGASTTKYGRLQIDSSGDFNIEAESGEVMRFWTGGSERVTIDNSGNVGIGTTSPSQKLHVEGQCVTGDTLLPIARETPSSKSQIPNKSQISNSNDSNGLENCDLDIDN
ncbi:hypothetical protein KKA69_05110, partial [Patescibacteria group bacterium]|nr:hypothetical protein [Patescibacteria group bacterium]